jgi:hypothetical protein
MIYKFKIFENNTNSNGKIIHSTTKGIENFWKWFGDSKVVDENNKPLIVYHGTSNITDFDKFNNTIIKRDDEYLHDPFIQFGIFFTNSIETANVYTVDYSKETDTSKEINNTLDKLLDLAKQDVDNQEKYFKEWRELYDEYRNAPIDDYYHKGIIYSVYLSIKRPLIVDAKGKQWYEILPNIYNNIIYNNKKYDGLIIKNVIEVNNIVQNTYVAFSASQIKSAISNNGNYSENETSILEKSVNTKEKIDIFRDNKYILVAPLTSTASAKYGANTHWCTSAPSNSYIWKEENTPNHIGSNRGLLILIRRNYILSDENALKSEEFYYLNQEKNDGDIPEEDNIRWLELQGDINSYDLSKLCITFSTKKNDMQIWSANNQDLEMSLYELREIGIDKYIIEEIKKYIENVKF